MEGNKMEYKEEGPMGKKPMEMESEATPFDDIVSRVKSYVENPALATKETLQALLSDLMEMKPYMDGEDESEDAPKEETPALMISLGNAMKKGKQMILAIVAVAAFSTFAKAAVQTRDVTPFINAHVSQDIYYSTFVAISGFVAISSSPAYLYSIRISSSGGETGKLEIFDAQISTSHPTSRKIDVIKGTVSVPPFYPIEYHVNTSSGICVNNGGAATTEFYIGFRQK